MQFIAPQNFSDEDYEIVIHELLYPTISGAFTLDDKREFTFDYNGDTFEAAGKNGRITTGRDLAQKLGINDLYAFITNALYKHECESEAI